MSSSRSWSRRTLVIATLVVLATLVGGVVPSGAAAADDPPPTKRDPLAVAKDRLDVATAAADDVARRMAEAQGERDRISAEIDAAEREIPLLQAEAEGIRAALRVRAAELYRERGGRDLDIVLRASNPLDGQRAAQLAGAAAAHDFDEARRLKETAHTLEVRQGQLRVRRVELERTVADLAPLDALLRQKLDGVAAAFDTVRQRLTERPDQRAGLVTGATVCPVRGPVAFTDDFGDPRDERVHEGIDMVAKPDTELVAVVDGTFVSEEGGAGGNAIRLAGVDDVTYYYAHLSRYAGTPRQVKAGDVIGYVGTTGVSTGPHLHFEVHPRGGPAVDPFTLLLGLCVEETARPRG